MTLKKIFYRFPTGILWKINGWFSVRSRKKKFDFFLNTFKPNQSTNILDVGPYGGEEFENYAPVNYLERWYQHKNKITVLSIEDVSRLKKAFPDIKVVYYDGKVFPFKDESFDITFSNAVIEHVGSRGDQQQFIDEMFRTGKKVYITTPNRWFVIEAHTLIPFLHWLPNVVYRFLLKILGLGYWAKEENLNLLTPLSVARLVRGHKGVKIKWRPWSPNIIITKEG